jgi:hypothetical protein
MYKSFSFDVEKVSLRLQMWIKLRVFRAELVTNNNFKSFNN